MTVVEETDLQRLNRRCQSSVQYLNSESSSRNGSMSCRSSRQYEIKSFNFRFSKHFCNFIILETVNDNQFEHDGQLYEVGRATVESKDEASQSRDK